MLYAAERVSNWFRNHMRFCANESGTLPLRSMGVSGTVPTAVTALESRSAS